MVNGQRAFQELEEIPGSTAVRSIDALGLEVLVRDGTKLNIHKDQVKQWRNSGELISKEFSLLESTHEEKFQSMLAPMIAAAGTSQTQASTALVEAQGEEEDETNGAGAGAGTEPVEGLTTYESLAKLEQEDKVKIKVPTAVPGVEVLLTENGKVFLLADKLKVVGRHSVLGGYGTGKLLVLHFFFLGGPMNFS